MARNDPQVNLRMPEELKQSLEAAAAESSRSLTAEIIVRLQDSLGQTDKQSPADLSPTVARLERDLAKIEMDKAYETLTLWVVASTLRPLLDKASGSTKISGPLSNMTASGWRDLCDAYIRRSNIPRAELDETFERMREAENKLRRADPASADPIWENMRALRNAMEHKSEDKSG